MFTLNCKGKLITIQQPIVMGIINATPDSFYANSQQSTIEGALQKATQMLAEGATILDIGGQTTKPGSVEVGIDEELQRVLPIIKKIKEQFSDVILSIDTYHAAVAEAAIEAGASMVNDVSGGFLDTTMLKTIAKLNVPYVCMHMKGTPQNMQENPTYDHVTKEILEYFIERIEACKIAGIKDVIVDPGFGFGKTSKHNFQLLKELSIFKMLERPILLGISRKSTIYKTLDITANEALNGTTVLNTIGLQHGANILRVHDVKEAIECIKLTVAMNDANVY